MSDVTFDMKSNRTVVHHANAEPWTVTLVDTGEHSMTGGRLRRVREYLDDEDFFFTYGDGLSDINLAALQKSHRDGGRKATVTAVLPPGRYGALRLEGDAVTRFEEKPLGESGWINGGYFMLSPKVLDYVTDDSTIWEQEPLKRLASERQLTAHFHRGFWQPMDTVREKNVLEQLWNGGNAPWKSW
jgi:glucose-1-phosphate cytidylyltransferase